MGTCTGSHIENDDGTCVGTGGFTTDLKGAVQGVEISRVKAWASAGAVAGAGVAAVASVPADIGTGGLNIPATPAELLGGAAAGAAAGGALGTIADKTEAIFDKLAKEIEGITTRTLGPEAEQYSLRAIRTGAYPNVRGGVTQLNAGDVWKYGQTTLPATRYSQPDLARAGLRYQTEFVGAQMQAFIQEKMKIYSYFLENGVLPPGNKIFR